MTRRFFETVPLLQSGQLPAAPEIPKPENLDPKKLEKLLEMGLAFFEQNHKYNSVAYTQFKPETQRKFGITPQPRRIILFSPEYDDKIEAPFILPKRGFQVSLAGSLLINPVARTVYSQETISIPEKCGSIKNGTLSMIIERPVRVTLQTWVYNPKIGYHHPTLVTDKIFDISISACISEHEITHLNGQDATNAPGIKLLDPWESDNNREICAYAKDSGEKTLVRRDNQLVIVNPKGNFLEKFRR